MEQLTEREKLIKLLNHEFGKKVSEITADYLLANGVTVPPCKVGDAVYETDGISIYESKIKKIIYDTGSIAFDETAIGKNVFLKREQAIKKLEGEKI